MGRLVYCKYNKEALANVSNGALGLMPTLVRLLNHQGFNEDTIIGGEDVKSTNGEKKWRRN